MGFHDDMAEILSATPSQRQTLLFSATYPETIREMSAAFQSDPIEVTVDSHHSDLKIRQHFYEVQKGKRNQALALYGDLEQKDRDLVLVCFANGSVPVLVATDVAVRGLDIKELGAVINYELPRVPEIYVHRIGRTGQAGRNGLALNLFIASEANHVNAIEAYLKNEVRLEQPAGLDIPEGFSLTAPNVTLCIDGGRKEKVRPGDILGALTADKAIQGGLVGKIDIFDHVAYVAVDRSVRKIAIRVLSDNKIKGRRFKVRILHRL
ncbi:MAG: DbpA RNA binding domain-containing protein [Candidatus Thiodiazotropha weberae]|nr:DbpA RNA binding domain-containing protein [Candidatus Thiodiazotropha lotti]ODB99495.1 hypothetical protein A3197_11170 [Candidatus Thiodiazotropha endoloripes]MCG8012547.1 DbpA RNA binding domain-containing protein [Candidatus Thiodiazotropha lotti]MCG8021517.1 DbpA RNA binding domain-containing protein [Candidatus Thiodiazotropha lotti]MCW4208685.1 DbpA RNA binding domain-containing protein [Candidatus Thiodiazotropha lotti]